MATNVPVPCYACNGEGSIRILVPGVDDGLTYRMGTCDTCKGFGFLVATELKAVETWVCPTGSSVMAPDFRYLWPRRNNV